MKKFLISFKRVLALGWKNFSREMGLSFVSLFILTAAILLVTSMFLLRGFSEEVIAGVQGKADITVDFEIMVIEEKILEIKEEIISQFEVNGVEYISREEARNIFVENFGHRPIVMEALEEVGNPFPASLNIKARDPQVYREVSSFLETSYPELIYAIDFYERQGVIDGIFSFTESLKRAGLITSIILIIIATMLVFNTIKLAIYGMKEEIRVMGLVGSSNAFIQGSFIVQGTVMGLVAALISFIVFLIFAFFVPQSYLEVDLYGYLLSNSFAVILVQLFTGVFLGVFSSIIATRKHLK